MAALRRPRLRAATIAPMPEPSPNAPVIVVGAGVAGLTAALRLSEAGHRVRVLEAADQPGGRARTLQVDGEPVDRGFQSLFTAYPRTSRLLDDIGITDRDLVRFDRGAVVHDGQRWARMSPSPRGALGFPWFHRSDVLRLARVGAEVAGVPDGTLLAGDERQEDIAGYLARVCFSHHAVEGFFRPLFGVITADPSLRSDAAYFRFLLKMLLRGRAAIPVEGHGMIARWAVARVRQQGGEVEMDIPVAEVVTEADDRGRARGVRTADGALHAASAVVLATGAPAARTLLADLDRQASRALDLVPRGVTTLVYELGASFHSGRTIVLNAAPRTGGPRVDLVCQESNLLRPGVGRGARLLASCVHDDDDAPDPEALATAMGGLAADWNPGFPWRRSARLAEVVVHDHAQFAVPPGARDALPDAATALENVFLAGDFTMHPSLEGAVTSGERAAEVARAALARHGSRGD